MQTKQNLTIKKENMQIGPELAVTWIFSKMLCQSAFLLAFSQKYLGEFIDVESVTIHREKRYGGKAIDVCVYLEDKRGNRYAIVIEAKTHWPDKDQLSASVEVVKNAHPDYEKVTGLYLLSTTDSKQLTALGDHDWHYPVLTVKDLLGSYCLVGIEQGYSIRLAGDMQALLMDC